MDNLWAQIVEDDENLKKLLANYERNKDLESAGKAIKIIRTKIKRLNVSNIEGDRRFANLISLSLYSGPLIMSNKFIYRDLLHDDMLLNILKYLEEPPFFLPIFLKNAFNADDVGWLHTGDINLKDETLYNMFKEYYKHFISMVGFCTIPHHGSQNSFNKDFIDYNKIYVITDSTRVTMDNWLQKQIEENQDNFFVVTENNSLMLQTISDNIDFKGKITVNNKKMYE